MVTVTIPGLGLVLAACGSTFSGTTLAQQVTSWATTSGFSASVGTLQGDIRRIDAGAETTRPSLSTDCDVLVTDTLSANQNLPTPDQTLTNLLSAAYSVAGTAGHDCFSGRVTAPPTSPGRPPSGQTARRDLIKALARFDVGDARPMTRPGGDVVGPVPPGRDADAYDRLRRRVLWSLALRSLRSRLARPDVGAT